MTKAEFIKEIIKGYEQVVAAREAQNEAYALMDRVWKDYLGGHPDALDLAERVIVRYGDEIYEVNLDLEEFNTPAVNRAGRYVEYCEVTD